LETAIDVVEFSRPYRSVESALAKRERIVDLVILYRDVYANDTIIRRGVIMHRVFSMLNYFASGINISY